MRICTLAVHAAHTSYNRTEQSLPSQKTCAAYLGRNILGGCLYCIRATITHEKWQSEMRFTICGGRAFQASSRVLTRSDWRYRDSGRITWFSMALSHFANSSGSKRIAYWQRSPGTRTPSSTGEAMQEANVRVRKYILSVNRSARIKHCLFTAYPIVLREG
jgi:hypothetical protein